MKYVGQLRYLLSSFIHMTTWKATVDSKIKVYTITTCIIPFLGTSKKMKIFADDAIKWATDKRWGEWGLSGTKFTYHAPAQAIYVPEVWDSSFKVIQYVAQLMLEYKYQSFRIDSMSSEPYKKGQFALYTGFIIGLKSYHTLS